MAPRRNIPKLTPKIRNYLFFLVCGKVLTNFLGDACENFSGRSAASSTTHPTALYFPNIWCIYFIYLIEWKTCTSNVWSSLIKLWDGNSMNSPCERVCISIWFVVSLNWTVLYTLVIKHMNKIYQSLIVAAVCLELWFNQASPKFLHNFHVMQQQHSYKQKS